MRVPKGVVRLGPALENSAEAGQLGKMIGDRRLPFDCRTLR
jgi:hypothetical protein